MSFILAQQLLSFVLFTLLGVVIGTVLTSKRYRKAHFKKYL